jgi:hypothetical protein
MAGLVYLLCAATCLLCAVMLLRGYATQHVRLLLWSSLCFVGLMIENLMLYIDVVLVPEADLSLWRKVPGVIALGVLLIGMIWDSK